MAIMVLSGLKLIFAKPPLLLLATGLAILVFISWALLPNIGLLWQIVSSGTIALADKISVVASLIGSIGTGSSRL